MGFEINKVLSNPLSMLGDHTTHPKLLPQLPGTTLPNPCRAAQPLGIATTPQNLSCLTLAAAPNSEPSSHALPGHSRALRGYMSKHNRRTADRKLRTLDWRITSIVLIEPNKYTFFY
jgi:hypothetical protein